ncbi:hypothetical protein Bhyg_00873 [Pseudolycoriella hygida]|uniref:BTB domain-containing protein n=1 Tax=Pseudolycoriella hygida TaxID=35572 RepID=A0A9Q0N9T7_9DIPT|nr:hypothetical protein Bhyg_00873 [Pseudolycoriella hygida]
MSVMSEDIVIKEGKRVEKVWNIKNWRNDAEVIAAAERSLYVEFSNPQVALRFFLRPKERWFSNENGGAFCSKWYSFCAEVLTQLNENVVVRVTASVKEDVSTQNHQRKVFVGLNGVSSIIGGYSAFVNSRDGVISLHKSNPKVAEVIEHFIYNEGITLNTSGMEQHPHEEIKGGIKISVTAQMYDLTDTGNNACSAVSDVKKTLSSEAEDSMANDIRNMCDVHDNYADLKLESKDHMTLDVHKFMLAARSRYLRKCIDDAIKAETFNGTIKMNINGKPLVAILHWIYSGELHENASNVMEEVVDAAILFELTGLMKLLDNKVITICNKANMFRLYQVAQKNGMPNAMDDISAFIRKNL